MLFFDGKLQLGVVNTACALYFEQLFTIFQISELNCYLYAHI